MSRARRRYYRTLLLAIAAMGALVWVAMDQFDVPAQEVMELAMGAVLTVAAVIVAAALMTGLWVLIRRMLRRSDRD